MEMFFKTGNIVKKTDTYWHGSLGEPIDDIGKLYVIEYSYGEKYGDGKNDGEYLIISMEDGSSSAWWNNSQLEFVEEGNKNLISDLRKKHKDQDKIYADLMWIKSNWNEGRIPTTSVLSLFKAIDFNSSFFRNGEYFILQQDWFNLSPIFICLFNQDTKGMCDLIEKTFTNNYRNKYMENFRKLYCKLFEEQ